MSVITIYCAPKVLRLNQHNCAFFKRKGGIYQFDVKGDNDKFIPLSDEDFNKHFDILSINIYHEK